MRMPVFTWMALIVSFLLVFALPILTVGLIQLLFWRFWDMPFFAAEFGGDPLLWQHIFWLFGHPEVYILILPAMGIVSEILPTYARKPLFGYTAVVLAGVSIAFLGFAVWAHHMFTVGLGPVAIAAFSASTMVAAFAFARPILDMMDVSNQELRGHFEVHAPSLRRFSKGLIFGACSRCGCISATRVF